MKYYSRKCIDYSRDRKITCGNEILLAGIQYYSRKWIITRGKKYYSRERIITRGNLFITRGNDILLAGEKYWQYMAPEGFRITAMNAYRYIHYLEIMKHKPYCLWCRQWRQNWNHENSRLPARFADHILYIVSRIVVFLVALLLTWNDFNPSMDK